MSDYRATPEQWAQTEGKSSNNITGLRWSMACCILELRTRIELLEATQHAHIEVVQPTIEDSLADSSALSESLVKRVLSAIAENSAWPVGSRQARAAIREVAMWLEEEFGPQIDWITTELREEAADG